MALGSAPETQDCTDCGATNRAPCMRPNGQVRKEAHYVRRRAAALHDDGREVYSTAAGERQRVRVALYALGFDRVADTDGVYEVGKVLPSYTSTFSGPLGSITVDWA